MADPDEGDLFEELRRQRFQIVETWQQEGSAAGGRGLSEERCLALLDQLLIEHAQARHDGSGPLSPALVKFFPRFTLQELVHGRRCLLRFVAAIANPRVLRQWPYIDRFLDALLLLTEEQTDTTACTPARRSRDEFLAKLAHELRTPLTAILACTEVLALFEPGDEEFKDAVATIQNNVELEVKIIDQIVGGKMPDSGPSSASEPTQVSSRPLTHHKRILVVDDHHDAVKLNSLLLRRHGFEVTGAYSGREALELVDADGPFDLLLSDISMPEMDGYHLLKEIRLFEKKHQCSALAAVALSAFASVQDRHRSLQAGFLEHLAKPAKSQELLQVIAKALAEPLLAER